MKQPLFTALVPLTLALALVACAPMPTEVATLAQGTSAITGDATRVYWVDDSILFSCDPSEAQCNPRVLSSDFAATRLAVDDTHVYGADVDGSLRSVPLTGELAPATVLASGCELDLFALDAERVYCLRWSPEGHRLDAFRKTDGAVASSFPLAVTGLTRNHGLEAGAQYLFLADEEQVVAIAKLDGSLLALAEREAAGGLMLAPGAADHLLWIEHSSETYGSTIHSAELVEGNFVVRVLSDLGTHVESLFATSGRILAINDPRSQNSTVYQYSLDGEGLQRRAHAVGGNFDRVVATETRIVVTADRQLLAYPFRF